MNKKVLIEKVSEIAGVTKGKVEKIIETAIDLMIKTLANGEGVTLVSFGTFEIRNRVARTGRNPKTGEKIHIPATRTPAFIAGKALRDAVKGRS